MYLSPSSLIVTVAYSRGAFVWKWEGWVLKCDISVYTKLPLEILLKSLTSEKITVFLGGTAE